MKSRTALVATSILMVLALLVAGCSAVIDRAAELFSTSQPANAEVNLRTMTPSRRQPTINPPQLSMILTAVGPTPGSSGADTADNAEPTATREKYVLTLPPPTEEIAEPLLTLTAFNALLLNRPTPTSVQLVMNGKPHLVDFWAGWCAPCMRMKPWIDDLQTKYGDRITFDRVDIDFEYGLANQYNVVAIPLVVLLDKNGKQVNRMEGLYTEDQIDQALAALLSGQ